MLFTGMDSEEYRLRLPSLLWIPLIICLILLFFVDIFQIGVIPSSAPLKLITNMNINEAYLSGFEIRTPGCKIPAMDPWDQNIKKFISVPKLPKCNKGIPALFASNLTSIYYLNGSLPFYNTSDINELKCCYRVFWRMNPHSIYEEDDRIQFSKECYSFSENAIIIHEFIEVKCFSENITIYHDMFAFVPIKNISTKLSSINKPLNVLVLGLDAVSRLNLHRQMPNTVSYLKEIGSIELRGYNKIGDNTFPNLIAILTGMSEEELKNNCWPNKLDRFDKCYFIWQDYKRKDYITAFGEDASWMGLFNYGRKGFTKQPTDYGYSYFNAKAETIIGNSHKLNVKECLGSRQVYQDFLDYILKFSVTMNNNNLPFFAFFWGVSLSHDFLNKPKIGENDYKNFFKNLNDGGLLESTALIFLSDHGMRWGGIRQTYQGRMEERLPFVIIRLPKWFRKRYYQAYQNLLGNVRKLTTPFDLHATLVDLSNPINLGSHQSFMKNNIRSISLFREISEERTCGKAGIKSHWCTCQKSKEIDINSSEVTSAANIVVRHINKKLEEYVQCAKLSREATLDARLMIHDDDIEAGGNKIQDFMLTLKTSPGGAIFEVTLRYFSTFQRYELIGTISRINLYGKQSFCITDYHLKLYCYCKSLLT